MSEILQQEGKLTLKRQQAEKLRLRLIGLAASIRGCFDPTEKDPAVFKTAVAVEQAFEADKLRTEYMALQAEIREINQYLGR